MTDLRGVEGERGGGSVLYLTYTERVCHKAYLEIVKKRHKEWMLYYLVEPTGLKSMEKEER